MLARAHFAVLPLGDRLVAAAVQRGRTEVFVVSGENPVEALRAEIEQRRLPVRTIALAVPRAAVTVKPIELPALGGEVREMISFELERHLPFPSDDASFDYLMLPEERNGATPPAGRHVVIAAADRRVVDGALRIAEEMKLRPVSLTVASHNLPALVGRRPHEERVVWIHRAGDTSDLLFLVGGTIALSRSVASPEAATVVAEILRSFTLVRWRGCDAVWVSGDGQPEVTAALTERGMTVTEPPYTPRARGLLDTVTDSPRGVLDLALAVAASRLRPLELLPVALRPRQITRGQLVTAGFAAATLLLALGALLAPGWRETRRLADLNTRITRLDSDVKSTERVLQELERNRRLLATIQSLETNSVRPLPLLRELTELLPNDAWLTLLSADTKGVELTGQASAAAALIPLLENSPRLERVEFSSPVTRGRDKEQFRIRASWEGSPGAVAAPVSAPGTPPQVPPGIQPRRPSSAPPAAASPAR
jgi:Tfp pilus assembly protein PilN